MFESAAQKSAKNLKIQRKQKFNKNFKKKIPLQYFKIYRYINMLKKKKNTINDLVFFSPDAICQKVHSLQIANNN